MANKVHGESTAWRRPGVTSLRRNTGEKYIPDAVGIIPELDSYTGRRSPEVKGREPYNYLLSVKSQITTGSARQKLGTEIEDLAGACDSSGLVAALIITGPAWTAKEIAVAKRRGKLAMVAVLTDAELAAGDLPRELLRVARARRVFARKLGPRGGLPAEHKSATDFAYRERRTYRLAAGAI